MARNQAADAKALYDDRSSRYDDSWHPRFARHLVEICQPKPGDHVLDLACGTGLVSFTASIAVGPTGSVFGVDVSPGLRGKQDSFDLITCASALVLLPGPIQALQNWTTYLKPGGCLIVDVTHLRNLVAGAVFERVGSRLRKPIASYRLNFPSPTDLRGALENAGLEKIQLFAISQKDIPGTDLLEDYLTNFETPRVEQESSREDAGTVFEDTFKGKAGPFLRSLEEADVIHEAKRVFQEEWAKMSDEDGKVRSIDCVYVGIGQKPLGA